MAEPRNPLVLKVSLIAFIIAAFVYGLGFFLFPGFIIRLSGFTGVFYGGWVNWAGGMLIALAIGAALALPNTKNQGILITTLALVTFFIGITLLYNWITIEGASLGFAGVPALINLLLSGMLWWSLFKARDFLKSAQGQELKQVITIQFPEYDHNYPAAITIFIPVGDDLADFSSTWRGLIYSFFVVKQFSTPFQLYPLLPAPSFQRQLIRN